MNNAWRATLFAVGLYLLVGANLPYLPVWLENGRGFSGGQISAMVAIATLIRIVLGPVVAARSEQVGLARVLGQVSVICLLAFGAVTPTATPFLAIFILIILTHIAWGVLMPLTDAILISSTKDAKLGYGTARAIASASFIVASLSGGALVGIYGSEAAIWWLVGAAGFMALASFGLPREVVAASSRPGLRQTLGEGFGLYRNRRILLAGMGASFIQATHAYYYNLGSNIWIGQGIDERHLGTLWSTGVAVEIVFLMGSGVIFARWSPGALILLGGLGAGVRWTLAGFAPPIELLYPLQTLHALSFAATHIGIIWFLAAELPKNKVPVALAINSAVLFGPMLAILGLVSGVYYDAYPDAQARGYWLMSGVAIVGCLCALGIVRRPDVPSQDYPQRAGTGGDT